MCDEASGNESPPTPQPFPCRSAHNPYRTRRFKRSVRSEADKGYFLVSLRDFFRSRQTVNLVISTVFFFDLTVIVEAVQLSVSEAVFMLFGFGCLKNCRQCVAEVHSTDFLSLGRSDLRLNSVYLSVCMQEIPYF